MAAPRLEPGSSSSSVSSPHLNPSPSTNGPVTETTPLIMAVADDKSHAEEVNSVTKDDAEALRSNSIQHGDRAAQLLGDQRVDLTEEDNVRIRKKIDKIILPILVWVYFLQILDKSVLGYGAVLGLRTDTGLTGNQYSLVSSVSAMAQLGWQPFSSYLIVKVPHRYLMPALVLGWGIAQTAMAGCHNFGGLIATRFFLGLFEAGCLPLFSVITSHWYRRSEQPFRIALWYGTNGLATMFAAAVSYGFGSIPNAAIHEWRILFIFVGIITIITAPVVYYYLDSDIPSARFLTDHEKLQAIERVRANQTGTGSREFKMAHVIEAMLEPKSWLFVGMTLCLNTGAAVSNTFGPLIIQGLGFNPRITSLLNIPFGAVQLAVILPSSWLAHRYRIKSPFLAALMFPVLAGNAMLYALPRNNSGPLLAGYYMFAFLFGANPLIVSWIISNYGGSTKKSVVMSLYNAGSSAGNIIGPLLFSSNDAPGYYPGLRKVLGIIAAMIAAIGIQFVNLWFLNTLKRKERVRNGKPADLKDYSMEHRYEAREEVEGGAQADNSLLDLTDRKNDEFIYVY